MERNRLIGLGIDLAKYIVIIVTLAYAWYIIAIMVKTGTEIGVIVSLQETQQIFLYYMILATVSALYYSYNAIMGEDFAPTYRNLYGKKDLLLTLMFVSIFIVASILRAFSMGLPSVTSTIYKLPLSFAYGVMGLAENMFFIGTLGFGIKYLLERRGYVRGSHIIAAIIVGIIAALWHLYMYVTAIMKGASISSIAIIAISVFTFFFIGSIISFSRDNTWVWDTVHFTNNFVLHLLKTTGYIIIW